DPHDQILGDEGAHAVVEQDDVAAGGPQTVHRAQVTLLAAVHEGDGEPGLLDEDLPVGRLVLRADRHDELVDGGDQHRPDRALEDRAAAQLDEQLVAAEARALARAGDDGRDLMTAMHRPLPPWMRAAVRRTREAERSPTRGCTARRPGRRAGPRARSPCRGCTSERTGTPARWGPVR